MTILTEKELIQFKGIWHSIKRENLDYIFEKNHLEAKTTQRYWKDGVVYRDNEREAYQNSYHMKGWSMTRDRFYACMWSDVILLLDWDLIKRDFKTKPFSWNYRIASCRENFDKEREEFVISNFENETFDEAMNKYHEILDDLHDNKGADAYKKWCESYGDDFWSYWKRKGKRTIDFDKYLLGIFIKKESFDIYKGKGYNSVLKHPLFKGFVSGDKARKMHKQSMKKRECRPLQMESE